LYVNIIIAIVKFPVFLILEKVYCTSNGTSRALGGNFQFIDNSAGSVGILSCVLPFVLVGSSKFLCNTTGDWEGNGNCRKYD